MRTPRPPVFLVSLWLGLAVFALALGLPPSALAQKALEPIRVQLKWTHQFQFAGYYAAIAQGYYREAGFDVSLLEHTPGITPVEQLIGGRVDYAVGDSGVLLYRATGVPLVALAAIFQESPSILLTLEESGIRELSDLRGKRIMLLGGYLNAELMSMLDAAGVQADDFTLLPADTDVAALIDGRTDAYNAYTTNEPFALSELGIPHRSFSPSDYGVDFYADILITTENRISRDPDGVRRFVEATLRGWRYAVDHPAEVVDLIFSGYNTQGRSRAHLMFEAQEAIRLMLPNVVPVGYMSEERWHRIEQAFRDQGQLTQAVDMNRFLLPNGMRTNFLSALRSHRLEIATLAAALLALGLVSHILRLRAQVRNRTRELELAREHAEAEARTDPLTGLPNRRYFFEWMTRDLARSEREGSSLALLSLDIDHFKAINDRFGHAAGDAALKAVATLLHSHIRGSDIAARIGGEEFAIACIKASPETVLPLAERLRIALESLSIEHGELRFSITASMGLAFRHPGDSIETLLNKADQALYRAKASGRNRVCEWVATR